MFVHDTLSDVLKLMTLVGVAIMLVYTRYYMQLRGLFKGEYYALILFATLTKVINFNTSLNVSCTNM